MHILKYLLATVLLIQSFALLSKVDCNGRSPLHDVFFDKFGIWEKCAKSPETIHVIKSLITSGCNVNARDGLGQTPLHYAIRCRFIDAAKLLLEAGANLNAQDNYGETPLHNAAFWWRIDEMDFLIKAGADLNIQDDAAELIHLCDDPYHQGWTPLAMAAFYKRADSVQLLLNAGADFSVQDYRGNTPLHLAAEVGAPRVVEMLLRAGADRNAKNNQGRTPLEVVPDHDSFSTLEECNEVKALLKENKPAGIDIDLDGYCRSHCGCGLGYCPKDEQEQLAGAAWVFV